MQGSNEYWRQECIGYSLRIWFYFTLLICFVLFTTIKIRCYETKMEECEKGQPDNHQPSQSSIICTAQDLAVDSWTATYQSSQSAICTAQGPAVVAQWQSTSGSSQTPGDCRPLSLSSIFTWILTEMLWALLILVLFADNSTVDTNISVFHSSYEHRYLLLKPILWPPWGV